MLQSSCEDVHFSICLPDGKPIVNEPLTCQQRKSLSSMVWRVGLHLIVLLIIPNEAWRRTLCTSESSGVCHISGTRTFSKSVKLWYSGSITFTGARWLCEVGVAYQSLRVDIVALGTVSLLDASLVHCATLTVSARHVRISPHSELSANGTSFWGQPRWRNSPSHEGWRITNHEFLVSFTHQAPRTGAGHETTRRQDRPCHKWCAQFAFAMLRERLVSFFILGASAAFISKVFGVRDREGRAVITTQRWLPWWSWWNRPWMQR